jgi:hypothetical protein
MRFKATTENLTIQVASDEVAACVRGVVRMLVPRHARKVYLVVEEEQEPPLEIQEPGLARVAPADLPSNFLKSFRLILDSGELVVVSGQNRFTREQWHDFAARLDARF